MKNNKRKNIKNKVTYKHLIVSMSICLILSIPLVIVLPVIFPTVLLLNPLAQVGISYCIALSSLIVSDTLTYFSKNIFSFFKTKQNKKFKDIKKSNDIKNTKEEKIDNKLKINNLNDKINDLNVNEINSSNLLRQPLKNDYKLNSPKM